MFRMGNGGPRPLIDRRQSHLGHQAPDPLATDRVTQATQMPRHLPRAIPRRLQKLLIEQPHLIEINHGSDMDDDPARFRTTVMFNEQSDGKTVITLRQLHPTKAQRDRTIGFGAVEGRVIAG